MERYDQELAFLLRYENVAWYENGTVRILDRRIYPTETSFVECQTYYEVIQAIKDMVTQSAGPYTAVGMGMALAAFECKSLNKTEQLKFLKKAAYDIAHARVTTANRYQIITEGCYEAAKLALENKKNPIQAIVERTIESLNRRYKTMEIVAIHLMNHIPENGTVLTQCFGETIIGMMCRIAKRDGKHIQFYCAETRPFFQGARLTASVTSQMGFRTTVISDNMIAYVLQNKNIDVFTSAADTITRDGHIANKIGTFQIAILAKNFGIPYFVTGIPDENKFTRNEIIIEERDPQQVLCYRNIKNTVKEVNAIYPSFDITPPNLISGIITDKGTYSAYDLESYFATETKAFY